MKHSLLAALVAFSLPAIAIAAPSDNLNYELFGKFNAAHTSKHNNQNGDDSYARLGVKADTDVSADLNAFGLLEVEYSTGKKDREVYVRQGYAGLQYGDDYALSYGRQAGVIKLVRNATDVLPQAGGDALGLNGDDYWFNGFNDNIASFTAKNVLVDNLNVTAQYLAKDETREYDAYSDSFYEGDENANGEGYGVAVQYTYGFASFGAAYTSGAVAEGFTAPYGPKHAESWAVSTSLDLNPVTLAASYGETRNQTRLNGNAIGKTQAFEVVALYATDFGLTPAIGWNVARADEIDGLDLDKKHDGVKVLDYVSFGATYALAENVSLSASYNVNLLGKDYRYEDLGVKSDDWFKVGLSYEF